MYHFTSVDDVTDPAGLVKQAIEIKQHPHNWNNLGKDRTIGLLFFNSSLRTRMSTQRAAQNLGMHVLIMNVTQDSWQIEMEEGVVMDAGKAEHVKEAAAVMGAYCDILGIRSFPGLVDRSVDYQEVTLTAFKKYAGVPVISLESATLHPLQSLADWITIEELKTVKKPKVVMTWAPHVKALPQAVPNSFAQWMRKADFDFTIAHPAGLELADQFSGDVPIAYDQKEALEGADFVYVKNWSGYRDYGQVADASDWTINQEKLAVTNGAKVMHCLPVRRNVVISDDVLDSESSVVIHQATNRIYAAQVVIKNVLESL